MFGQIKHGMSMRRAGSLFLSAKDAGLQRKTNLMPNFFDLKHILKLGIPCAKLISCLADGIEQACLERIAAPGISGLARAMRRLNNRP
jgi:hypothetical protein